MTPLVSCVATALIGQRSTATWRDHGRFLREGSKPGGAETLLGRGSGREPESPAAPLFPAAGHAQRKTPGP